MATLKNEIIIRAELRPCKVRHQGKIKKALFHKWMTYAEIVKPSLTVDGEKGGQLQSDRAIVELENGCVTTVEPWELQFVDNIFSEYTWAWKDE